MIPGLIPGEYEKQAMLEIQRWKTPPVSSSFQCFNVINKPLNAISDSILRSSAIGMVLQGVIGALTGVCNDMAQLSVRRQAILKEFRQSGRDGIEKLEDIRGLPLKSIDENIGCLRAKYKGLALAEGMGAGLAGIAGLALDIPSLVTLNLRAIGEYATYYGFDIHQDEEKIFALSVLSLVSSPTDAAKNFALAQIMKISRDIASERTWGQLQKHTLVNIIRKLANMLGIRLTKAKLAQTLPVVGAAIGGGYNVYFTAQVCDAAYHLYRERFLLLRFESFNRISLVPALPGIQDQAAGVPLELLFELDGPAGSIPCIMENPGPLSDIPSEYQEGHQ